MDLLCAVYMDLPHAYQAYLFATININQRKVDKSLAYEQFGYNLDEENKTGWAPDKLAVYLTRKLNLDPKSPLHNRIRIAPLDVEHVFSDDSEADWQVSTACMVEGIAHLISSNPKADRSTLHTQAASARRRSALPNDTSPLRQLFLDGKDEEIHRGVLAFFDAADAALWKKAKDSSYIRRTIGIQALFDVLRAIIAKFGLDSIAEKSADVLRASGNVDFGDTFYQASGKGRVRVKNTLLLYADLIDLNDIQGTDGNLYSRLLKSFPKSTV